MARMRGLVGGGRVGVASVLLLRPRIAVPSWQSRVVCAGKDAHFSRATTGVVCGGAAGGGGGGVDDAQAPVVERLTVEAAAVLGKEIEIIGLGSIQLFYWLVGCVGVFFSNWLFLSAYLASIVACRSAGAPDFAAVISSVAFVGLLEPILMPGAVTDTATTSSVSVFSIAASLAFCGLGLILPRAHERQQHDDHSSALLQEEDDNQEDPLLVTKKRELESLRKWDQRFDEKTEY
jgi:hypothetical protein